MNRESATFQLSTGLTGPSFIRGTTSYTWLNFNLRDALGTLWDKYDRLKIYCTSIIYFTGTSANNDRTLNFYLSGVPLEYQTYNYTNNKLTNEAFIGSVFQNFSSTNTIKVNPSTTGVVFTKEQGSVNLTIQVKSGFTQAPPVAVSLAGASFCFMFMVYGVEEVPRLIRNPNPKNYPLVLSGYQATTQNASKTRMQFQNIDLRQVIGDDYDKYDRFKLILSQYVMNNQNNGSTANFSITVDGLPFQNATYTTAFGVNTTNTSQLGMARMSYWTAASTWYVSGYTIPIFLQDYNGAVFGKYQDRVNLVLSLVYMGGTVLRPENYANSTFYFNIVPIEE